MKKVLANAFATKEFGVLLARSLPPGTVILLEGDLGAGKTTLVQGIGQGLGIAESIDSPTFTLINEYFEGRIPLYHLDLYRLEPPEVAALHLEHYWHGIETPLGIVAIEWAEKLRELPGQYLRISLNHQPDDTREIKIISMGQNLPRELEQI